MAKANGKKTNGNGNMKLWSQVCETDPQFTKKADTRGGFTAICAQYQRKTATNLWGPYGSSWGMKDLAWDYVRNAAGDVIELYLSAVFFCPGSNFEIAGDIAYRPGNDCHKKLQTDITTKALSMLGFNSDVFEGKFDDNKYIEKMKGKYADKKPAKKTTKNDGDMPELTEQNIKVLNSIFEYFTNNTPKGKKVDPDLFRAAIFKKWGKFPTTSKGGEMIVKGLDTDGIYTDAA